MKPFINRRDDDESEIEKGKREKK